MATIRQIVVYNYHKQVCGLLGIPQMTLRHRSLRGQLDVGDPNTGNQIWSGQPAVADEVTTNTLIWLIWRQRYPRSDPADDLNIGRDILDWMIGQCPAIDDNQNTIVIADEDWLVDQTGVRWRLNNPMPSPDAGFWLFEMERQR